MMNLYSKCNTIKINGVNKVVYTKKGSTKKYVIYKKRHIQLTKYKKIKGFKSGGINLNKNENERLQMQMQIAQNSKSNLETQNLALLQFLSLNSPNNFNDKIQLSDAKKIQKKLQKIKSKK